MQRISPKRHPWCLLLGPDSLTSSLYFWRRGWTSTMYVELFLNLRYLRIVQSFDMSSNNTEGSCRLRVALWVLMVLNRANKILDTLAISRYSEQKNSWKKWRAIFLYRILKLYSGLTSDRYLIDIMSGGKQASVVTQFVYIPRRITRERRRLTFAVNTHAWRRLVVCYYPGERTSIIRTIQVCDIH